MQDCKCRTWYVSDFETVETPESISKSTVGNRTFTQYILRFAIYQDRFSYLFQQREHVWIREYFDQAGHLLPQKYVVTRTRP